MRLTAVITLALALFGFAPAHANAGSAAAAVGSAPASNSALLAEPHLCAGSHSTSWRFVKETYWGPERTACAKCMEYGRYLVAHGRIDDFTCIRYTGHTELLAALRR
ncbi:MAG: hypothetical protein V9G19_05105 [Tetrasphaera sp.]